MIVYELEETHYDGEFSNSWLYSSKEKAEAQKNLLTEYDSDPISGGYGLKYNILEREILN